MAIDPSTKKDREKLQKKFGEHLVKLRKSMNITGAVLARRCEMEKSHMSRLEHGHVNATLFQLKKLADGLGITLEQLMKGLK